MHEHVRVLYSQGDICMRPHMHLGLLYELVLRVWECGRRRPLACQYVLMLHIWFPNFPFSLSALPSAPSNEMSGHCFVFAGWWRGCQMSDGPVMQHITFPSPLFLSLVHSFLLLFRLYSGALTPRPDCLLNTSHETHLHLPNKNDDTILLSILLGGSLPMMPYQSTHLSGLVP